MKGQSSLKEAAVRNFVVENFFFRDSEFSTEDTSFLKEGNIHSKSKDDHIVRGTKFRHRIISECMMNTCFCVFFLAFSLLLSGCRQFNQRSEKTVGSQVSISQVIAAMIMEPNVNEKTVESKNRSVPENKPEQKSSERSRSIAQTTGASRIDSKEKIINLGNGVMMRLSLIPKGEYFMGSSSDQIGRDSDEGPVHKVRIDKPFYMGVYEVTQEQYEKVIGRNPSVFIGPKYPIHVVSWNEAQEFCRRLSSLVGGRFRLPTEAEWEYACRAGTTTAYYWGNSYDEQYGWTVDNSEDTLHEVGTRLPNDWGLYDMSGNLWEWCENRYLEHYPGVGEKVNLIDSPDKVIRVLRGGSWNTKPVYSRSANRSRNAPGTRMDCDGIRVVLDVK